MTKKEVRLSKNDLGNLVNSVVPEAVEKITEAHPRLRGKAKYMLRHVDQEALSQHVQTYLESISELGGDREQVLRALGKNLANYVLSGRAFDEHARELILRRGLGATAREKQDYLGRVILAFNDIYEMFKEDRASAENMPELAKAATIIHKYGFLDTTIDMLRHYEVMGRGEYNDLRKAIARGVEGTARKVKLSLRDYVSSKAAAVFLGLIGISLLVSTNFTGAVVGGFKAGFSWIGIVLIVVSWILMLKKK